MNSSIKIFEEYPETKFIPLIPVQTVTQISPLHKVGINVVKVSTEEQDRDVYKEKNTELALTKKGLMKLMAAANIQVLESKSVTPSSCQRCLDMARETGKPALCRDCECRNDIAWQVTIAVPDMSGGVRRITQTREFLCADEMKKMGAGKQYDGAFAFRAAHTESKALNRALRDALMLKATYKPQELAKPFAVPVIAPNFDDPDMKAAAIRRYSQAGALLYGDRPEALSGGDPSMGMEALPEIVIPPDEPDPREVLQELPPGEAIIECHECGAILEAFTDPRTKAEWSVEKLAEFGRVRFGAPLCRSCVSAKVTRKGAAG